MATVNFVNFVGFRSAAHRLRRIWHSAREASAVMTVVGPRRAYRALSRHQLRAQLARLIVQDRLPDLFLTVHYEGAIGHHRLAQRRGMAEQQQRLLARLDR